MAQQIKTKFIEDLAITTAKIAAGAVTGAKIESSVALAGAPTAATASLGTNTTQLATTAFVQAGLSALETGLKPKQAVRAASSSNIAIASGVVNAASIGGVTVATGDRVLLYGQSAPEENGIYIVAASGAASRATDFDALTPTDEINRAWVPVQEGTHAGKIYVQYGTVATLGTDPITFTFYDPITALAGGDMITLTGSTISVDLAAVSGLESSNEGDPSGELRIKLEAANPTLQIDGSNQLGIKLDTSRAITTGASGVGVNVDDASIEVFTNALRIKDGGVTTEKLEDYAITFDKIDTTDVFGAGLAVVADKIVVNVDDSTIEIDTNTLRIKDLGITNAKIANGTIDLTTKVTGMLPVANGGTGASSLTDGALLLGNGTDPVQTLAPGGDGEVLTVVGGAWVSAAPAAVYVWGKEKIVLDGTDISNGYVDLAQEIQDDSLVAFVGRLAMHDTEDYTLSVEGGVTRVTFTGSLATGQPEALVAGDNLFFTYQY
jgi:hypothetical protein